MHNLTKIKIFRILLWISYPISLLLIYPFAMLRKKNSSHIFFFLDRYALGGAQRIHIDILNAIKDVHKQLYFTRFSPNDFFKNEFYSIPNTEAADIHIWCDNLLFRLFTVHYWAFYVNRHKRAHVFSSNSTFFYDMLPFLKKHVIKTELLHNFTHGKNGMEFFGLANYKLLNYRIVYDNYTLSNIKKQYLKYSVPDTYLDKILFIEPGVEMPATFHKNYQPPLNILYAGRGGPQKRINLLDCIAKHCIKKNLPVKFHFAGTMADELSEYVKQHSVLHGEISDQDKMAQLYRQSHILLMTSAYEGFPMFIKEGMANGCIPVVTALEGNKTHLRDNENSLLIENPTDEAYVVEEGINKLTKLINDSEMLVRLSHSAHQYAISHFTRERFIQQYRRFFELK